MVYPKAMIHFLTFYFRKTEKSMRIILLIQFLITSSLFCCDEEGKTGIFPENNLKIPPNSSPSIHSSSIKSLSENLKDLKINSSLDFELALKKIEDTYTDDLKNLGYTLYINKLWEDGSVNARTAPFGQYIYIEVFGGLARHPDMTTDGLVLAVCHELGHHIGGAPKNVESRGKWATNEGQSDYFASMKCFKKVFQNEDNISKVKDLKLPEKITSQCNGVYKNENESAMCLRAIVAAKALGTVMSSLRFRLPPKLDQKDTNTVSSTFHGHPEAQCRLDTYIAGALCDKPLDQKLSSKDPLEGTCNRVDNDKIGLRPLCWYKPGKQAPKLQLANFSL